MKARILAVLLAISSPAPCDDTDLRDALSFAGLTPSDLTIPLPGFGDSLQFDLTRRLLTHPLSLQAEADGIVETLAGGPTAAVAWASGRFGSPGRQATAAAGAYDLPMQQALAEPVAGLLDAVRSARATLAEAGPEVLRVYLVMMRDGGLPAPERDALLASAADVDLPPIIHAARSLAQAVRDALDRIPRDPSAWPRRPLRIETESGVVQIGTMGDDRYAEPAALILDPGGDDVYDSCAAVADGLRVSVAIDMGGNDRYQGPHARANGGIAYLLDVAGDDVYEGGDRCQGSASVGVAVLEDREGDDRYAAGVAAQGFGLFGVGILWDTAGADRYEGDLLVQGVGAPRGVGLLVDEAGDDSYRAGGRYRDFREPPSFQSMAQGFGMGIRTSAAGGIGVLYDVQGDDRYQAETFAQGSGTWMATGLLVDGEGDDAYVAHRFAQGCGSHLSSGGLVDAAGHDIYRIWGVGQGCGHDLSIGVLADREGDDAYQAEQLAQGAARSNGIGILDDADGQDRYTGGPDTQGFGHRAREHGSIGVLMDRAGEDVFQGPGGRRTVWVGGTYGVGVDVGRGEP